MRIILEIFWLLLPAGAANITPVLVRKVNFLNYPIDANKTLFGNRIFGENKTWRGLFFGIGAAIVVLAWQKYAYIYFITIQSISFFDYAEVNVYGLGFLFGFGALFGDLVKSFFKRRLKIPSGSMWIPFDQIDWIFGALIFLSFYFSFHWSVWVASLLFYGFLHPIVNLLGYWLRIKKTKF